MSNQDYKEQQQKSSLLKDKDEQFSYEKVSIDVDERWDVPIQNTQINIDTQINNNNNQGNAQQEKDDSILRKTFSNFRSQLVRADSNSQFVRSNTRKSMNQIIQSIKQHKHKNSQIIVENKQRNSNTAKPINYKKDAISVSNQKLNQKNSKDKSKKSIDRSSPNIKKEINSRSLTSNAQRNINIKIKNNSKSLNKLNMISKNKQFVIKNKQKSNSLSRSKTPNTHFSLNSKKPVPEQILDYLKKREDVEIIQYFEQYKKQFFIKSKTLQDYIYNSADPQKIKNTYMNQNDNHFKYGLETIMLKLFRNGTIVPKSYDNLRQQAVQEIEKWVIGWIHRKILYGKLVQDEQNQLLMVEDSLKHLQDYKRMIENQDTSF